MHILIRYTDRTEESVPVRIEDNIVDRGGEWHPGYIVDEPKRCLFRSDYFMTALNEGNRQAGSEHPEAADQQDKNGAPDWLGFEWVLVK